jgi:hypothetical protein
VVSSAAARTANRIQQLQLGVTVRGFEQGQVGVRLYRKAAHGDPCTVASRRCASAHVHLVTLVVTVFLVFKALLCNPVYTEVRHTPPPAVPSVLHEVHRRAMKACWSMSAARLQSSWHHDHHVGTATGWTAACSAATCSVCLSVGVSARERHQWHLARATAPACLLHPQMDWRPPTASSCKGACSLLPLLTALLAPRALLGLCRLALLVALGVCAAAAQQQAVRLSELTGA